jgi:prepilin-type N-terminal cleavage/methylation domain-containing protein
VKIQTGYSLLEVMVSLLLIGLILYLFEVVQMTAGRISQSAYFLTVASEQMYSMKERLLALDNHGGVEQQLMRWKQQNLSLLPQAHGIVLGHYPHYLIEISWREGNQRKCLQMNVILALG